MPVLGGRWLSPSIKSDPSVMVTRAVTECSCVGLGKGPSGPRCDGGRDRALKLERFLPGNDIVVRAMLMTSGELTKQKTCEIKHMQGNVLLASSPLVR